MRIFAFHLLNDYSGSPKVLMQLLKGWTKAGLEVHLCTSARNEGFLSNISQVSYHFFRYRFSKNRFLRLLNFLLSQLIIFFRLLFTIKKGDIIYINTILPFGAALLGKIKGCRIIYHIHETSVRPAILKKFLFRMVSSTANDVIYVSQFLAEQEPLKGPKKHILYNAIEDTFLATASENKKSNKERKNVLMVCSLKAYKGVNEFVQLAKDHPQLQFRLVLNASQDQINDFFKEDNLPKNIELFDTQKNIHPWYQWADVILNLSHTDAWIETFGLTIIEGMAYDLPAIVPPVGGIAELVENDQNGYKVDSKDQLGLNKKLKELLGNQLIYEAMQKNIRIRIYEFSETELIENNLKIIKNQKDLTLVRKQV